MSVSQSPSVAPQSGGNGPYLVGIVVLLLLGGGIYYATRGNAPTPPVAPLKSAEPITEQAPPPPPPPPPPPAEEPSAEPTASAKAGASGVGMRGGAPSPCSAKCAAGTAPPALRQEISAIASTAKGCYNRALRTGEASGSITVAVRISPNGQVCGASIARDDLHSNEISQCVIGRFSGRTFTAPQQGCVTVEVPIRFELKQ